MSTVFSVRPVRQWTICPRGARAFIVLALAVAALSPSHADAQGDLDVDLHAVTSELEREILREMLDGAVPSLTVALVGQGKVLWTAGFGESNLRSRVPATPSTVYLAASTFKTMVAAAVLQLYEEGHFDLDDPVREFMADELRIERERGRNPVTFRQLLTHTSGLPSVFSPVSLWADHSPPPMKEYLRKHLTLTSAPSDRVHYSNVGYTLLAHLVEEISGEDFREYVRDNLFLPLGMRDTDFAPSPEMEERMAIPYVADRHSGRLSPTARIRFAEWPAAGVWSTVEDQGRWLAASLNGGAFGGSEVLSPESVELSHTVQYEQFVESMAGGWGDDEAGYGLAWWVSERNGERYIAHAGSVRGYTAFLHGNVDRGVGVAFLTNGHRAHSHLVRLSYLATDLMARYSRSLRDDDSP